jgi:hypothetical protein
MQAALGLTEEPAKSWTTKGYDDRLEKDPEWRAAEKLWEEANHIGLWARFRRGERRGTLEAEIDYWCTTTLKGRLWFHPPDVPVRVWAVSVDPHGIIWAEAEVTKVTQSNVMVRYAGKIARQIDERSGIGGRSGAPPVLSRRAPGAQRRRSTRSGRTATAPQAVCRQQCRCRCSRRGRCLAFPRIRITRRRMYSRPSAVPSRRHTRTLAAPPRCSGFWLRRAIGYLPR